MTVVVIYCREISLCMGFGKDHKGVIIRERPVITLGALGAATGILSTGGTRLSDSLGNNFRILKTTVMVSKIDQTSDEGSLLLYMVDGELSLTEIEQSIENSGPVDRNDADQRERSERWVTPVAMLNASTDITVAGGPAYSLPIEFSPRWTFSNPEAWDWFVYNAGAAMTTGTIITLLVTHYGVWV